MFKCTEMEFKEFEPRFKSAKTRFKLSAGLNLETFDTILSGRLTIFKPRLKFKPPLKFFIFGHRRCKNNLGLNFDIMHLYYNEKIIIYS